MFAPRVRMVRECRYQVTIEYRTGTVSNKMSAPNVCYPALCL